MSLASACPILSLLKSRVRVRAGRRAAPGRRSVSDRTAGHVRRRGPIPRRLAMPRVRQALPRTGRRSARRRITAADKSRDVSGSQSDEQNLQVENKGPMTDIFEIVLNPPREVSQIVNWAAIPFDLRETGETRPDRVAALIFRHEIFEQNAIDVR